jgi:hypothetical protein
MGIFGMACAGWLFGQDANEKKTDSKPKSEPATSSDRAGQDTAIDAARERAKLLHDVYSATLDTLHHHYFRHDTAVVPARAMEDVFEQMARLSGGVANWISVNTKAMSINHEPTTAFEKNAAAELSAGKDAYEEVGKRVYRRAAPIALGTNCVGCHTSMFSDATTSSRIAGLVISIPLKAEER